MKHFIRQGHTWLVRVFAWVALGQAAPFDQPPDWARDAIWYQIFVERFRNGDPSNDPRPEHMQGSYPGFVPEGWKITPWHQDWYEQEDWAKGKGDPPPNPLERDKIEVRGWERSVRASLR